MDTARVHVLTRYIGPVKHGAKRALNPIASTKRSPHFTSRESSPDSVKWDSGILSTNAGFSFTFNQPGTFGYACDVHPFMTSTITATGPWRYFKGCVE